MNKVRRSAEALAGIREGMTVMIGGFLAVGTPLVLVDELVKKQVRNLTVIANDTAMPDRGIGRLIVNRQAKKVIVSHIGTNPETGRQLMAGELEVELTPQGTLAEKIRAGGSGLGGVLTPTGVGTVVEEGKQKIKINDRDYLLELPLRADVALIYAHKADKAGNLVFRRSARNFNPVMAMAADLVIAQVSEVVEIGAIDPDEVMVPGIVIDYIVAEQGGAV
ncbi:acetate CoA/acetoacetate CoA-transferase alpha subunit [Anaerospora hongkongensis]|uniref:Acetate CoA/acetoacetate CoA-transferase alpha subunit n=1 Tax=Anaerospora hongkongensis TaxID=244830 RepID=A0A4R1PRH5_9FIRM|nr:acetate CoA-transferase subunit alpha [Anaerospora hongkongensis]TCL32415.1 acetate CoA/acetoacetate CoA-transferase alpha subunit [Anaerospora hongkongensis]